MAVRRDSTVTTAESSMLSHSFWNTQQTRMVNKNTNKYIHLIPKWHNFLNFFSLWQFPLHASLQVKISFAISASEIEEHKKGSVAVNLEYAHPRRPRGSQSGREKRRGESFQVRAKEPLGTDSHRTISKNSTGCRLLIGHKKCFVLLC